MVTDTKHDSTEVGNYFIANYPPFSFWNKESLPAIEREFAAPAKTGVPLGLYLHIPFCRKRCKFCYFRVYTDVNAQAIQQYVDALAHEVELLSQQTAVKGREFHFVYFGGGTPSYLAPKQLHGLVEKLHKSINWDTAKEVTFECEPGTLSEVKLQALKDIGVTRLSLGIENFSDAILEENGRAHLSAEVYRCWEWIRKIGFEQVNVDLIAGMVGENWENWKDCIAKTIAFDPDSVTIYQMELPYNTTYSKDLLVLGQPVAIAPWSTKREWLEFARDELEAAGYKVSSAYTFSKPRGDKSSFLYRDALWRGADLLGTGVASFGHLGGVHYQNVDGLQEYQDVVATGKLPLGRALVTTAEERFIREMVLQMKLGYLDSNYFTDKFGIDIRERFADTFAGLRDEGYLSIDGERINLSHEGLLRVDSLLPRFFLPQHQTSRYA